MRLKCSVLTLVSGEPARRPGRLVAIPTFAWRIGPVIEIHVRPGAPRVASREAAPEDVPCTVHLEIVHKQIGCLWVNEGPFDVDHQMVRQRSAAAEGGAVLNPSGRT